MAGRGYAVASIDYRLYFKDSKDGKNERMKYYRHAIAWAVEDLYRCIDYLSKSSLLPSVDYSSVFVSGGSAGAITSLASVLPVYLALKDSLGAYFTIGGAISAAGATFDPDALKAIETPLMLLHGACDSSVFINRRAYYSSKGDSLARWGPLDIYNKRLKQDKPTQLVIECHSGHEVAWLSLLKHIERVDAFIQESLQGKTKSYRIITDDKGAPCSVIEECR
jgi:hypothetical protein